VAARGKVELAVERLELERTVGYDGSCVRARSRARALEARRCGRGRRGLWRSTCSRRGRAEPGTYAESSLAPPGERTPEPGQVVAGWQVRGAAASSKGGCGVSGGVGSLERLLEHLE
jgi:hypothetical protein